MSTLSNSLIKNYTNIVDTDALSDIEILVGKIPNTEIFRLHSFILKVCSPYFRNLLSNEQQIKIENNIIRINIPNISVKIFKIIIKYIYVNNFKPEKYDFKTNAELLIAADELSLNNLSNFIENYLLKKEELLKQNFVFVLQDITNELNRFVRLSYFCNESFRNDPLIIFKAKDFTLIKQEVLIRYLDIIQHCARPIDIWDKIIEWTNAQSNGISSNITKLIIQPFISFINFKEISRLDFYLKVRSFENIFDDKLYIEILEHYSFNDFQIVNHIDSQIINLKEASFIANRIRITKRQRREVIYNFNLLVRGSRDGFSEKIFHEYCDDKGPTITIIHVKNSNEILGGFNPFNWESWKSNKGFIETKESFIFSLDRNNLENSIFSKVVDNKNAIYNSPDYGPCFGGEKSDIELFRREKYGRCVMTSYEKEIRQDEKFFEVDEYEVFQVSKII
ncbi:uncharacterized protein OCT59_019998 [Rhizophagus irregularis]|uniref:Uncharacterized protein n=2 Tax=Rhizophagus irregularis TaxID=588596 RepID=U9UJV2_RHIID|nr:hypothetical protein GLOIN_2v1775928 [Rhizophagus irregularis DAOM 181602=DAOM 197198]EXX54820.1 hypothetical protein RirG_231040 [Rhizophagus irregularis DAOM 197198w]POG70453.1 hypothetical protein GLOIN_2v1775928 [Rhizophagus irregularis DAOM 181602=DAOM 197198]UZO27811.1 hypothetical protein OCT59_019998 [Rhizophagus irregularis]GBC25572.1 BTB/POZ protein [Rhizophagus irregularis DAOM 181602=DAOM 197198]|eukprot:XP_025177319.1 hypothetical protein GLOIN_2v1775928 [Rhizophagus irregularis DAOM 181602=DAOM 197198]